jgi:small conductance mechanosensitive channel
MDNKTELLSQIQIWVANFGVKALSACLILLAGIQLARVLQSIVNRAIQQARIDATLALFASNLVYVSVFTMTAIIALGQLGVQTASFIAILGSIGVALGLALQGSLSNFAAGIWIIVLRPFKVGDYIECLGIGGTVKRIHPLNTTIITPDHRTIVAPNRKLFDDCLTNHSAQPQRRIDFVFSTKYEHDIDRIEQIVWEVLAQERRILTEPKTLVGVLDWGTLGMRFAVRPWVHNADYEAVYFELQKAIKQRFDKEGIAAPCSVV